MLGICSISQRSQEHDQFQRERCQCSYSKQWAIITLVYNNFVVYVFFKLIKNKSDALNKKITSVLVNQAKFLSYCHKSFLRFCSHIWLRWLCTVEVATKRGATGCSFVIM